MHSHGLIFTNSPDYMSGNLWAGRQTDSRAEGTGTTAAFGANGAGTNEKGRNWVKNGRKKNGMNEGKERDTMC